MMFVYDPLTRVNFISQILLSENIAYDFGYNLYPGSGKNIQERFGNLLIAREFGYNLYHIR